MLNKFIIMALFTVSPSKIPTSVSAMAIPKHVKKDTRHKILYTKMSSKMSNAALTVSCKILLGAVIFDMSAANHNPPHNLTIAQKSIKRITLTSKHSANICSPVLFLKYPFTRFMLSLYAYPVTLSTVLLEFFNV